MCLFNFGLASTGFSTSDASNKAALACLLLWVICYGASAGPIGFVAAGETSTPRLRAQTTSFNMGCYGIGLYALTSVRPPSNMLTPIPVSSSAGACRT
jgi:hypothetical protein